MGVLEKFKVLIKGKKALVPLTLDQISTKLWQKIANEWDCEDALFLFCLFTDQDYKKVIHETIDSKSYENMIKLVRWFFRYVLIDDHGKKSLGFPKVDYPLEILGSVVPKFEGKNTGTMSSLCMGQMNLHDKIVSSNEIALSVANVMQPIISGQKWNRKEVTKIEKMVLELPITQTFPLAYFFLSNCKSSLIHGLKH